MASPKMFDLHILFSLLFSFHISLRRKLFLSSYFIPTILPSQQSVSFLWQLGSLGYGGFLHLLIKIWLFTLGSRRHSQLQKVRQALPQRTHPPIGCQCWLEQHQSELLNESQGGLLMVMGWTGKQTKFAVRTQKNVYFVEAAGMHKGRWAILFICEYRVCLLHWRQP